MVIGLILVGTFLIYYEKGGFCATVSFTHFILGMFSLVVIPANIFIVNSKHLQTATNT